MFLGKVEIVEESSSIARSITTSMRIPSIVRLLKFVAFKKRQVKFSRHNIYARDRFLCQYCGRKLNSEDLTYDHVIPRSIGGKTEWGNIVTCCISCNRQKGGRTPQQAGLTLIKKPTKPVWIWGFHSRFAPKNTPDSWRDYLYWNVELVE